MRTVRAPKTAEHSVLDLIRFECAGCAAVLDAEPKEGRLESDRDGTAYVFTCPHCGRETWCDASLVRARRA